MMSSSKMNYSHHFYSDDEHSMDKKLSKDYLDFNEQVQDLDTMSRNVFQHFSKQQKDKMIEIFLKKRNELQENVKHARVEENVDEYVEEHATDFHIEMLHYEKADVMLQPVQTMVMNAANSEDFSAMGKAETLKITYSKPTVKMNHELLEAWRLLSANLMDFLLQQSNSFGVYRQVFDPGGQLSRSMQHLLMEQGYGIQGYFDVHG